MFNHWPKAFRRTHQLVLLERFVTPVSHCLLSFPEHIITLHGVLAQKLEVLVRDDVPVGGEGTRPAETQAQAQAERVER